MHGAERQEILTGTCAVLNQIAFAHTITLCITKQGFHHRKLMITREHLLDKINTIIEGRKMVKNASYFAFTATPKNKTLEMFGKKECLPDGTVKPDGNNDFLSFIQELLKLTGAFCPANRCGYLHIRRSPFQPERQSFCKDEHGALW